MHTTVKNVTEAVDTCKAIGEWTNYNSLGISINASGVEFNGCRVEFPDTLEDFNGSGHYDPATLKKIAKESGKPGQEFAGTLENGKITVAGVIVESVAECGPLGVNTPEPSAPSVNIPNVAAVADAASREDMRPVLCGVNIGPTGTVATDSYRLHVDTGETLPEAVTIPSAVIRQLHKLKVESARMDKEGGNYRLEATTNSGNVVKIMRAAIDGQFPNYEQLFPETYEIAATIDPEATREQAAKILRWVSNNTPGRIVISDRLEFGYEGETDVEPVSIGRVQGNPELTTIGVNPEFFAAAVEYVDSPDAKFHAIGPLRPVCLETGTRRALVMPIRLQD
jgi:hypothetical protein